MKCGVWWRVKHHGPCYMVNSRPTIRQSSIFNAIIQPLSRPAHHRILPPATNLHQSRPRR
eukprot:scaffold5932_cov96-Skeletonema_dohrnii-CCMP3373.AAC.8